MSTDTYLFIAAGILPLIMAALGGHLASNKLGYRIAFWSLGLITAITVVIVGIRTEHAQSALQAQLNHIQKNTETPPQVTVNQAPITLNPNIQVTAPPGRALIQYINASQFPPKPPTFPLREGQAAALNIGVVNFGTSPARGCKMNGAVYVFHDGDTIERMFQSFLTSNQLKPCADIIPGTGGNFNYLFNTYYTPALSALDISTIEQGKAAICGVARTLWRDDTGHYQTDFCQCMGGSPQSGTAWPNCLVHYGETKLK